MRGNPAIRLLLVPVQRSLVRLQRVLLRFGEGRLRRLEVAHRVRDQEQRAAQLDRLHVRDGAVLIPAEQSVRHVGAVRRQRGHAQRGGHRRAGPAQCRPVAGGQLHALHRCAGRQAQRIAGHAQPDAARLAILQSDRLLVPAPTAQPIDAADDRVAAARHAGGHRRRDDGGRNQGAGQRHHCADRQRGRGQAGIADGRVQGGRGSVMVGAADQLDAAQHVGRVDAATRGHQHGAAAVLVVPGERLPVLVDARGIVDEDAAAVGRGAFVVCKWSQMRGHVERIGNKHKQYECCTY